MLVAGGRVYGLDILRAAAIISVLYSHAFYKIGTHFNETFYWALLPDGVSLFFVLSGFLIGGILIKTVEQTAFESSDLKTFWIRRWLRTLPAYFFILFIVIISSFFTGNIPGHYLSYLKYLFFLQSLTDGYCFIYPESWSLCVEEWFYLFVPIYLYLLIRHIEVDKKKIIFFCIASVIAAVSIFRIYKASTGNFSSINNWDTFLRKTIVTRLDSIMYGSLGAYLMYYNYAIWNHKNALFLTGILLFIFLGIKTSLGFGEFHNYVLISLESIAALFLIPKLITIKTGKGVLFCSLTFISKISYSIYLINFTPYNRWLEPWMEKILHLSTNDRSVSSDSIRLLLFLFWSIGGAYILYRFIEVPFMNKRVLFTTSNSRST